MSVREDPAPEAPAFEVLPEGWPRGAGYAHAISARGRVVCVAGQVGWDPRTNSWRDLDLPGQTAQALRNIVEIVHAAGGTSNDIVRLTWFLTDREQYVALRGEIGAAYRAVFGRHYPAMSVVVVSALVEPQALVEIEATAVIPE